VAAWLAAHPIDARILESLDDALAVAMSTVAREPDGGSAYRHAQAQLSDTRTDVPRRDMLPLRRPRSTQKAPSPVRRWLIAGAVAVAVVAALLLGGRGASRLAREDAAADARGAAGSVIETGTGVRDSVRLADGSRVVLAPGSRLAVLADYGRNVRAVQLDGVAWFSVRHDAERPFTVHTSRAVVRDLGTEFVVRADSARYGNAVAVLVTEGRVALRGQQASESGAELSGGDRGDLGADDRVRVQRGVVSAEDVAWTSGRLVYRAASLDEVRADLRRWYGVDLRVSDSTLSSRRLTATFQGEPLVRVLEVLSLALGAQVEQHGTEVVLRRAAGMGR
jgi:transmembrane sensor